MAQLYFRYSTMNAGKSTEVLKIAHNYEEQNKKVLLFTPAIDDGQVMRNRYSDQRIERDAIIIAKDTDLYDIAEKSNPFCILIDEGQFLSREQVIILTKIVDKLNIPVIVYGLKNDYRNQFFPGSEALILFADKIEEVKTVCWYCTKKATMLIKFKDGKPVNSGKQIELGGNDKYTSVCRKCYSDRLKII